MTELSHSCSVPLSPMMAFPTRRVVDVGRVLAGVWSLDFVVDERAVDFVDCAVESDWSDWERPSWRGGWSCCCCCCATRQRQHRAKIMQASEKKKRGLFESGMVRFLLHNPPVLKVCEVGPVFNCSCSSSASVVFLLAHGKMIPWNATINSEI